MIERAKRCLAAALPSQGSQVITNFMAMIAPGEEVRALSGGRPFPLLIGAACEFEFDIAGRHYKGIKSIEIRSWFTNYRGWVLLHVSQMSDYDWLMPELGIPDEQCPKSSIVGAAKLVDCIRYTSEELWERDRSKHMWVGGESYEEVVWDCYGGKPPCGHIFSSPVFFDPPILNVPGDRNYWLPKKPHQQSAFEQAIALLNGEELADSPVVKETPCSKVTKKPSKAKTKKEKPISEPPNALMAFDLGSLQYGIMPYSGGRQIWRPCTEEFIKKMRKRTSASCAIALSPEEMEELYTSHLEDDRAP